MAYRVVVAPVARDDLIEIGEYIAQDSPDNARQWVAQLEQAIASLSSMPERVAKRDDLRTGYHVLPVGSHLIFFRIIEHEVQIARVIHAARAREIAEAFEKPSR